MTRDEVKKLLMIITATYPNFKPDDMKFTIDAWYAHLASDDFELLLMALKEYDRENTTGFAPSVGQLLNKAQTMINKQLTELEAWSLVQKALSRSGYYASEEFEKLPKVLQKAVGSPDTLRIWATSDTDIGVIQSNFMRSYRMALEQNRQNELMSPQVKQMIAEKNRKMIKG